MVVQVVQLKQKESKYTAQKAELEKQYTKESERADEIESMQQYMQSDQYIEDKMCIRDRCMEELKVLQKSFCSQNPPGLPRQKFHQSS